MCGAFLVDGRSRLAENRELAVITAAVPSHDRKIRVPSMNPTGIHGNLLQPVLLGKPLYFRKRLIPVDKLTHYPTL